jgi:type I restriction enzyme, S subunit
MSRIPSLPRSENAWRKTTVGVLCDEFNGEAQTGPFGSQLHASDYTAEGVPVVMPADIDERLIKTRRIARVPAEKADELARHKLKSGDIVFGRRGDVGRFAVVTDAEEGWLCGTGCLRVRFNSPDVESRYMVHYLDRKEVKVWLQGEAKGTTMPNLNTEILRRLPLLLPPRMEQQRLASILDRAETLRAQRRRIMSRLDHLSQSVFIDMFGDAASNPKRWPMCPMGDLFSASPIFGTMIPPSEGVGEWLSIRVANIQEWQLDLSDSKYLDLPENAVARHSVLDGDLLMARAIASQEHLGKSVVANPNGRKWAFDSHLMRLRFAQSKVLPEFVRHLLMTRGGRSLFLKVTRRTAVQYNINTKEISRLRIPLPPLQLQRKFIDRLSAIEQMRAMQLDSVLRLDALFESLKNRAFAGEL